MLKEPDVNILDTKGFELLHKLLSDERIAQLIVPGKFDQTVEKLYKIKDSSNKNTVQDLLSSTLSPYSSSKISASVLLVRKSTSDMLEISYKTDDAGVCVNTLKFLIEAFSLRSKELKVLKP